jgi:transposase-like protein
MNTQIDPSRSRSINPEVKQKILEAVKNGTMKVVDAAKTYGISAKTIYHWLTQHIGGLYPFFRQLVSQNQSDFQLNYFSS